MADLEHAFLGGTVECPGCRMERRKKSLKGPPLTELFFIAVIVLSNALPISSLFPFLYFMVKDFGIAKTDKDIGYYAGYIGSAFMFGRFLTSTAWGVFSDKYGRKPVMVIGTSSITNFWMALASRFLLGLFNGMLGPVRAYATEVCTEEYTALGLSMVGTFWGLGLIVGPAVGGYLAQPSLKYPNLFPVGSLFDKFPFALPCLAISLFAAVTVVISFWIPESMHNHPLEEIETSISSNGETDHDSLLKDPKGGKALEGKRKKEEVSKKSLLKNWGLMSSIALFCIWGLHDVAYTEIFSLWAVSPRANEGLSLTTADVGVVLAISGAALLVFQLFLFPPFANFVGPILVTRYPAVLSVPLVLLYPIIGKLHGVKLWLALVSVSVAKNVFSACISTGSFLLINNSVSPDQRGAANGLSMSFMSLFKAMGPLSAGVLFSWAQKRVDTAILPGAWMIFFILGAVALICVIITFEPIIPKYLNKSKGQELLEHEEKDMRLKRPSSFTCE